jgi:hypothetical protein
VRHRIPLPERQPFVRYFLSNQHSRMLRASIDILWSCSCMCGTRVGWNDTRRGRLVSSRAARQAAHVLRVNSRSEVVHHPLPWFSSRRLQSHAAIAAPKPTPVHSHSGTTAVPLHGKRRLAREPQKFRQLPAWESSVYQCDSYGTVVWHDNDNRCDNSSVLNNASVSSISTSLPWLGCRHNFKKLLPDNCVKNEDPPIVAVNHYFYVKSAHEKQYYQCPFVM